MPGHTSVPYYRTGTFFELHPLVQHLFRILDQRIVLQLVVQVSAGPAVIPVQAIEQGSDLRRIAPDAQFTVKGM